MIARSVSGTIFRERPGLSNIHWIGGLPGTLGRDSSPSRRETQLVSFREKARKAREGKDLMDDLWALIRDGYRCMFIKEAPYACVDFLRLKSSYHER